MRYRRLYINGATYFFTLVAFERQKIFANPDNVFLLKKSFAHVKKRHFFEIDAIVVLPDHLHCLLTLPDDDSDFSLRLRLIKSEFSKKYMPANLPSINLHHSRNTKNEKYIWQRRFWEHQIRDEKDFNAHMDYIHYNPVKHGLISSPKDWPYSSFLRCVKKGFYNINWGTDISDEHFCRIVKAE